MATPLIPQEIYLLEMFSSVEYFSAMRNAWQNMLDTVEAAMARHMSQLPADYRNRPLSEQADYGWGQRVIPNFRSTMADLNGALIRLQAGDLLALKAGNGPQSDEAGQSRDYPAFWMTDDEGQQFDRWKDEAATRSRAVSLTATGAWSQGSLLNEGVDQRFRVALPGSWPLYRLNQQVRVRSGDNVPRSGIYLPDAEGGVPQLMIAGDDWPAGDAWVGRDQWGHHTGEVPTVWTLVERIAETGGGTPGTKEPLLAGIRLRCEAGSPCPREGWWFTPAKAHSRRQFRQGEVMPSFTTDYGATIWQWDERQD